MKRYVKIVHFLKFEIVFIVSFFVGNPVPELYILEGIKLYLGVDDELETITKGGSHDLSLSIHTNQTKPFTQFLFFCT